MKFSGAIVAAALVADVQATGTSMKLNRGNPIRKVVNMIQEISKKVEAEGKVAEDLFDKFMCECNKLQTTLTQQIEAAESKGSDVASALEAGAGQAKQLQADLAQAKTDRAAAKEAIAAATGIREKEAKDFKGSSAESKSNIASMGKAVSAIEAGGSASFIQTEGAKKVINLVQASDDLSANDHDELMAFLQGEDSSEGTGEIVGMLKQMKETMAKDLSDAEATEADAKSTYVALVKAKNKEFNTLQAGIEEKMARLGELGVANAEAANDGGDTGDALEQDKKLLAESKAACADRQKAWDAEKKTRAEELVALSETIEMLNSDEALELFKKALPASASSFMQVQMTSGEVRARALAGIHAAQKKHKSPAMDFIALALHGKKVGFDQVITMIDKMIGTLKTEQKEDDDKKAYCEAEFDKSDDEKKALERKVSDADTAIADAKGSVATLIEEIKATKAGIVELDGEVAIATAQRMQENSAFKTLVSENGAAKQLIGMAKKRLNKFYNPSQAFVQVSEQEAAALKKAAGVIQMMATLENDLDTEIAAAEAEEKNAQADYEVAMEDAKEKRTADSKLVEEKESAKAEADESVQTNVDTKKAVTKELDATKGYIMMLHADCDWLLKYFDTRKQARADEIDAMSKAKDVLNGADFSFLQTVSEHSQRRLRGAQQ